MCLVFDFACSLLAKGWDLHDGLQNLWNTRVAIMMTVTEFEIWEHSTYCAPDIIYCQNPVAQQRYLNQFKSYHFPLPYTKNHICLNINSGFRTFYYCATKSTPRHKPPNDNKMLYPSDYHTSKPIHHPRHTNPSLPPPTSLSPLPFPSSLQVHIIPTPHTHSSQPPPKSHSRAKYPPQIPQMKPHKIPRSHHSLDRAIQHRNISPS